MADDVPEGFDDPDAPDAPEPDPEPPVASGEALADVMGEDTPEASLGTQGDLSASVDTDAPPVEEPEEPEPTPREPKAFPPEHKQAFEGLMHIGRLSEHVDAYGHDVVISTLTMEQMMTAGLLHKRYRQTLGDTRAWQAAVLAGSIQSVDGQALPIPVADVTTETLMRDRFEYIIKHWFPPTVDLVYSEYLELEGQVEEVLRALGGASG